jgi:predicted dehydrogenase
MLQHPPPLDFTAHNLQNTLIPFPPQEIRLKPIRVGLLGTGARGIMAFGRSITTDFLKEAALVAVADTNPVRAEAGLGVLGIQADIHTDYHRMLARKDIDAVIITTPDGLHEEHCIAAFRTGKHVLVDKPLATSAEGCLKIIQAAKKVGKLLYMGFNMRHVPTMAYLKKMADDGVFGEIFTIHSQEHYSGGRTYMARWNRLKKYSGGLFIHKGSHDFDAINWLMGVPRPVRVSCFGSAFTLNDKHFPFKLRKGVKPGPVCSKCPCFDDCPDHYVPGQEWGYDYIESDRAAYRKMWDAGAVAEDGYQKDLCIYLSDKDTHDQGVAIVEYDNGATAMHSECFVSSITERHYMIDGTLAHAEAALKARTIKVNPRWSQDVVTHGIAPAPGGHGGSDPRMIAEFMRCMRKDVAPTASGVDGAWSVAIGEAAELSRATGRTVSISDVMDVRSPLLRKR